MPRYPRKKEVSTEEILIGKKITMRGEGENSRRATEVNAERRERKLKKALEGIPVREIDLSNVLRKTTLSSFLCNKYSPSYCPMLIEHMSKGYNFESFTTVVGVSVSTINLWKKEHPNFLAAYEIGVEVRKMFYQNLLITNAQTGQGNAQSCIFLAKNTLNYTDKSEMSISQQVLNVTASIGQDGSIIRRVTAEDEAKSLLSAALSPVYDVEDKPNGVD